MQISDSWTNPCTLESVSVWVSGFSSYLSKMRYRLQYFVVQMSYLLVMRHRANSLKKYHSSKELNHIYLAEKEIQVKSSTNSTLISFPFATSIYSAVIL